MARAGGAIVNGARVITFEMGPVRSGTTVKSGGMFGSANNAYIKESGIEDLRDDAPKFLVRCGVAHLYREDHPTLGLSSGGGGWPACDAKAS